MFTPENREKCKEVAALDGTIPEMAFYCDVSRQTIYNWFKADQVFAEEIERLRQNPILKARRTIVEALAEPENAKWYLSRKQKKEFAERQELTGAEGGPIETKNEVSDEEFESLMTGYARRKENSSPEEVI